MAGTNLLTVTLFSVASYFLAQWLLPRCRFSLRPLLSPLNWFLVLYFVLLVLVPCVVVVEGPSDAILPELPTSFSMNVAMILQLAGFWTFCGSVHYFRKKRRAPVRASRPSPTQSLAASGRAHRPFRRTGRHRNRTSFRQPAKSDLLLHQSAVVSARSRQ